MKSSRAVLLLGALAMGVFVTYLATLSVADNIASDSAGVAAHRIANAAALFLVTAGFGSVLVSLEATTKEYLFAVGKSIAAVVAAILAIIWTARRSRFPLL